jgi:hypothetical protein
LGSAVIALLGVVLTIRRDISTGIVRGVFIAGSIEYRFDHSEFH